MSRPTSTARGYGVQWRKARAGYLAKHPFCVDCARKGEAHPATNVDHVRAWQTGITETERLVLFWDSANWAPLCASHHSRKTASVDGGYGNPAGHHTRSEAENRGVVLPHQTTVLKTGG
jgi:5-methylcytosine-specific restriction protein A